MTMSAPDRMSSSTISPAGPAIAGACEEPAGLRARREPATSPPRGARRTGDDVAGHDDVVGELLADAPHLGNEVLAVAVRDVEADHPEAGDAGLDLIAEMRDV